MVSSGAYTQSRRKLTIKGCKEVRYSDVRGPAKLPFGVSSHQNIKRSRWILFDTSHFRFVQTTHQTPTKLKTKKLIELSIQKQINSIKMVGQFKKLFPSGKRRSSVCTRDSAGRRRSSVNSSTNSKPGGIPEFIFAMPEASDTEEYISPSEELKPQEKKTSAKACSSTAAAGVKPRSTPLGLAI